MSVDLEGASCELAQALSILNLLAQELESGLGEVAYGAMTLIELAKGRIDQSPAGEN